MEVDITLGDPVSLPGTPTMDEEQAGSVDPEPAPPQVGRGDTVVQDTKQTRGSVVVTKAHREQYSDWTDPESQSESDTPTSPAKPPGAKDRVLPSREAQRRGNQRKDAKNFPGSRKTCQKGIFQSIPKMGSVKAHVREAAKFQPPINQSFSVPEDLQECLRAELDPNIGRERTATFNKYKKFANKAATARRNAFLQKKTPEKNREVMKKFNLAMLEKLLYDAGMNGEEFIGHMTKGFPITGIIDQPGVFDRQNRDTPEISRRQLLIHGKEQARKLLETNPGTPQEGIGSQSMAELNWAACVKEVETGAMLEPVLLKTLVDEGQDFVPTRRFGVIQADPTKDLGLKHRPIDDCKESWLNRATAVRTPAQLSRVDDLVTAIATLHDMAVEAGIPPVINIAKGDHKGAYKQIAIRDSQRKFLYIICRNPQDGELYAFEPISLVFGSTAAVIDYNTCSLAVTRILRKLFLLPLISYFDDFVLATLEKGRGKGTMACIDIFNGINQLIGFQVHKDKEEYGQVVPFLGIVFDTSVMGKLRLFLDDQRIEKIDALCEQVFAQNKLPPATAATLAGKFSFAQSVAWGRLGRAKLKPLYYRQHCPEWCTKMSPEIKGALKWLQQAVVGRTFETTLDLDKFRTGLTIRHVFTDAASSGGLAAVSCTADELEKISLTLEGLPGEISWSEEEETGPTCVTGDFENYPLQQRYIQLLEALAILLFLDAKGHTLRESSVVFWIDNTATQSPVQRGYSSRSPMDEVVDAIWARIAQYRIRAWFERVDSVDNLADQPSRKVFQTCKECNIRIVEADTSPYLPIIEKARRAIQKALEGSLKPPQPSLPDRKKIKFIPGATRARNADLITGNIPARDADRYSSCGLNSITYTM